MLQVGICELFRNLLWQKKNYFNPLNSYYLVIYLNYFMLFSKYNNAQSLGPELRLQTMVAILHVQGDKLSTNCRYIAGDLERIFV